MKTPESTDLLQAILHQDSRYTEEAYIFVRAGLDFTVRRLNAPRHVSGGELLDGIREYALEEFGPMTKTLLAGWGITCTEDIGEIVFNMVESGLLGKTDKDSREDFAKGYDFDQAFCRPFQPAATTPAPL
ncbi:MAG: hypothetical protein ISR84_05925 [Kiritimatiellales bacterium]|nr:hypothetical protein [Kiritimatiellales bacterium]